MREESSNPEGAREAGSALNVVKLFGVPVRFHFTFVLLFVFIVVAGLGGKQSVLIDVVFVASLFASVLLHELGHSLTARRYGIRTVEIIMYPIGGLAKLEKSPPPRAELWIAMAGPAVNIVIAALLFLLLTLLERSMDIRHLAQPTDANLLERIAAANLILAAFNMLPAFPMDGGRVLRAILSIRLGEESGTRIAARAGKLLAFAMGLYGLLSAQFMLLFIAFFVYMGASYEGEASLGRSLTHGMPVSSAMITQYLTLQHGSTLREAAEMLLSTSQQDFPVVHGEQVIGLLDRNALLRGLALEGQESYVSAVMRRDFPRLPPGMDLAEALPLLAESGSCALVMEGERLVGLLTRDNLSEFLLLRRIGVGPPPRPQSV